MRFVSSFLESGVREFIMSYKTVSTSIGGVVILILSIISFIFVPTMIQRGGTATKLGSWDGIPIRNTEDSLFIRQYRDLANMAEYYNLVPNEEFSRTSYYQNMTKIAFDSSVIELAMQSEVEKAGYVPPEFLVDKALIKYYLDDLGMYSTEKYQKTPANTRSLYKKTVESGILSARFIEDLFGNASTNKGGLKMSSYELNFIKDMAKKVREYKYVSFTYDDYPNEEIKKYGMEKSNLFDKYDFSALVYQTKEEAQEVLTALKDGTKSFDEALGELETKRLTDNVGKLEKSEYSDIALLFPDDQNLNKVTSLKTGELSDVMETSDILYMILRCDGDVQKANFDDDDVIKKVFNKMKSEDSGKIEEYLLAKGKELRENAIASNFDDATKSVEKEIKESEAFALNYGSLNYFPSIDHALASASKNEDFYKDLFSLKDGELSAPHVLDNSVFLFMQVSEKDSEKDIVKKSEDYKSQHYGYNPNYALIRLYFSSDAQLSYSQRNFIEFIEKSPKRVDNHDVLFAKDEE